MNSNILSKTDICHFSPCCSPCKTSAHSQKRVKENNFVPADTEIPESSIGTAPKMVYHSSFVNEEGVTYACGCPLLPLKSHVKGPAPAADSGKIDIVDEAITFFRANVFFRKFEVNSTADKLLIYLTLYINMALKRLEGSRTLAEGTKAIINLGLEKVLIPGEPGFPFAGLFSLPQSQQEADGEGKWNLRI